MKDNLLKFCPMCGEKVEKLGKRSKRNEDVHRCFKKCVSFFMDSYNKLNFINTPVWVDPCIIGAFTEWHVDREDKAIFILEGNGIGPFGKGIVRIKNRPAKNIEVFSLYCSVNYIQMDNIEKDLVSIRVRVSGETQYYGGRQKCTRSYDLVITVNTITGEFKDNIENQKTGELQYY